MTRKVEAGPVGYPGLAVMLPPGLRPTPATLRRVALAKLSGIRLLSASFAGERVLFQPWLTVLVDHGPGAFLTGVYRSDEADDSGLPVICLRRSEWSRDPDLDQARAADSLRDYLLDGPQVAHKVVFATRASHPEVDEVMATVLARLRSGITVVPSGRRTTEWEFVACELADEMLTCRVEYSPLVARSETLEAALPAWLERVQGLLGRDGVPPEGEITISIDRSVPELAGSDARDG